MRFLFYRSVVRHLSRIEALLGYRPVKMHSAAMKIFVESFKAVLCILLLEQIVARVVFGAS